MASITTPLASAGCDPVRRRQRPVFTIHSSRTTPSSSPEPAPVSTATPSLARIAAMCKEWETRIGMRGAHKNELTRSPPGQDTQVFFDGCVAEPFDEKTIRDFAQLSDPASYLDVESEVDFVSPSLSPGAIVPEMVFLSDEDVHPRQNNIGQGTEEDEVDVGEEDELSNAGGAAVAYDAGVEEGSESGDDFNTSSHTTGQNNNGRALTAASLQNGLSVKDKDVVDYKVSRFPGWSNEASAASTESSIEDLHRSAGFVATN